MPTFPTLYPSAVTFPSGRPAIHVREKPPLRQHIEAKTPRGRYYRWAEDEPKPENVFSGLRDSSTMPGGYESLDAVLPRLPGVDYADLERLTTLRVIGAGGRVDAECRLEGAPRVSGDRMAISPSAVGWQAALDDDKSPQWIPVDRDMSHWQEATLVRRAGIAAGGFPQGKIALSIAQGGIVWDVPNEALPLNEHSEAMYVAPSGCKVAKLGYQAVIAGSWTNFEVGRVHSDDNEGFTSAVATPLTRDGAVREAVLATPERYLMIRVLVTVAHTPAAGVQQRFPKTAVYSDHGLPTYDIAGEPDGVLASDVVAYGVRRWAPLLQIKPDSIQPSGFVIPHLAFLAPTPVSEQIRQASRFELPDWGVWDDREFVWHARGARGRRWRARIGPSQLEDTGPQVSRLWESILVQYTDADGTTRTVGPPGSGADTESELLKDPDPENPANRLGMIRRDLLVMGTGTPGSAIEIGARFLELSKVLDSSGRAQIVGYIEDDRGVLHPYSQVRAGDDITFIDSNDKSYRRIVRAEHTRETRTCAIDLDAPPEGLDQLLERLDVELVPLALG